MASLSTKPYFDATYMVVRSLIDNWYISHTGFQLLLDFLYEQFHIPRRSERIFAASNKLQQIRVIVLRAV